MRTGPRAIALTCALVGLGAWGCGAPAGRGDDAASSESAGDEEAQEDARTFPGGTWAPRASLARVEDVPRAGKVEERPSRTGAVRLVALMPVDGTGNHMVEIVGVPALDSEQVVASLRASHVQPLWIGCDELVFVADGTEQAVDAARHDGGVSTLGVMEAIQGRIPLSRLDAAAAADVLVVKSCENEYAVADGPALLGQFVARFRELAAAPAVDAGPRETDEPTDEPADAAP
jgi:hypothetical protein